MIGQGDASKWEVEKSFTKDKLYGVVINFKKFYQSQNFYLNWNIIGGKLELLPSEGLSQHDELMNLN